MVFDQLRNQECRCHRSTAVFRGDRSIAGRKAPRGGRFYDRSSALSGHRKIHRRQQGPVQYFGHRCFLKKIVERNSHGFRYLTFRCCFTESIILKAKGITSLFSEISPGDYRKITVLSQVSEAVAIAFDNFF